MVISTTPYFEPSKTSEGRYPVTPDGRYFVVRGKLWRRANPDLSESDRAQYVSDLMTARKEVALAQKNNNQKKEATAHADVDIAKKALGERGPVWWTDGAPDYNRHAAKNTPYASWYEALPKEAISAEVRAQPKAPVRRGEDVVVRLPAKKKKPRK